MVSVYAREGLWFCAAGKSVTSYKDLHEAMDAAYRQTNNHGTPERSHSYGYDR